jgi:hypothetical protein
MGPAGSGALIASLGSRVPSLFRRGHEQLPGGHLHQLVDPDGVARSLLAIAGQMGITTA